MSLAKQDELRRLIKAEYPSGANLTAFVKSAVIGAKPDFVMPRDHIYGVYKIRLNISREVIHRWFEGLEETVEALENSLLENVRLINCVFEEGNVLVFADKDLQEIIGVVYFKKRLEQQHISK